MDLQRMNREGVFVYLRGEEVEEGWESEGEKRSHALTKARNRGGGGSSASHSFRYWFPIDVLYNRSPIDSVHLIYSMHACQNKLAAQQ